MRLLPDPSHPPKHAWNLTRTSCYYFFSPPLLHTAALSTEYCIHTWQTGCSYTAAALISLPSSLCSWRTVATHGFGIKAWVMLTIRNEGKRNKEERLNPKGKGLAIRNAAVNNIKQGSEMHMLLVSLPPVTAAGNISTVVCFMSGPVLI